MYHNRPTRSDMSLFNRKTSSGGPGTAVFVAVRGCPDPMRSLPRREEWAFSAGVAVAGRIEGGKLTRRKVLQFTGISEFWQWVNVVRHAREHTWIVTDGLTETLTLLDFWGRLDSGEFTLRQEIPGDKRKRSAGRDSTSEVRYRSGLVVSEDPPAVVSCWHKSGWGITIVDWANYSDKGVRKLAGWVGVEWRDPVPDLVGPPDYFGECLQTADTLAQGFSQLVGFWKEADLGQFRLTIASGALSSMRHGFGSELVFCPSSEEQIEMERSGVFVGRCDAFWVGDTSEGQRTLTLQDVRGPDLPPARPAGPFTLLDCSSFYGFLLSDCPLPIETLEIWREGMEGELAGSALGPDCMASVTIDHETERFPYRGDTGQYWPVGRYQTTLCGPELMRAVDAGAVAHVTWSIRYRLSPWAAPWAEKIWGLAETARETGRPLIQAICKAMLARLGGKFGQSGFEWKDLPDRIPPAPWARWVESSMTTGITTHYRAISWAVQAKQPAPDPDHCWPAVFAFLTAYGREFLGQLIKAAGPRNTLYCATDSLLVIEAGRQRLEEGCFIAPGELGMLRPVETAQDVTILGPMAYRIGKRVVLSGKPLESLEVSPGVWVAPKRTTLRGILSRQGGSTVPREVSTSTLGLRSAMGLVGPTGWVDPWKLGNPDPRTGDPDPFRGLQSETPREPSVPPEPQLTTPPGY